MALSCMDSVTDALISIWGALPALEGVSIYDGPPLSASPDLDMIAIGDDADPESDASSTFEQDWADLAHTRRTERGEIVCAAVAQSGDTNLSLRRTRAFELLRACEAALLADPTLGNVAYSVEMFAGSSKPIQNSRGAAIIVPFTVRYWTQL